MAKKKKQGHYCRVCGERKANEKFSGKGHAKHVCKECNALPQEKKNELQLLNQISKIAEKYPRSGKDWELLEKYSKNKKYPEAMEFAQMILGMSSRCSWEENQDNEEDEDDEFEDWQEENQYEDLFSETIAFSEVDEDLKDEISFDIYEITKDFILKKGYIPEEKDKQKIVNELCRDVSSLLGDELMPDDELNTLFDEILKDVIENLEQEGIKPVSYCESLLVLETERLQIRKFVPDDLSDLYAIMKKPEVMYAWGHGFTKNETRKWLNRQLTRHRKEGYGYFAVISKETGKLVGQAGLLKNKINEEDVVELGYIFDNLYWKQGYCMETVKTIVQFAFNKLQFDNLYCSIRPNNIPSIRIAEKIGMTKVGEHTILYRDKDMLHHIYILKNNNC
ncbi:RimJ/RimL family protein N-acetyltransferase [Dysgonomonas alginatilytica]|uniref:RimJ/RimL family protein N-acetyltransferase n=1 Tax=Dysgonomonas alginatilytica TaxID=1605892 RepID=A0A2V3PTZ8_9BACT|nr:GNAT family N-acetyltransferase [Dysgonomonas alginatilytica]PXV62703.1 RimJ/RimL family protein N-acetyltransferase [Dysgonomonas alginatilytica]